MRQRLTTTALLTLLCLAGRAGAQPPSLAEAYAGEFLVGGAIGTRQIMTDDHPALEVARRQFNTITPENLLKWSEVHPEPERYDWEAADRLVEFGEANGMFIVGHTLVWHSQTPRWVFQGDDGEPLNREQLLERMREHIHAVVGRYKGRIGGWDVVNEAVLDDGSPRETPWRRIIGEDYIEKAFQFAHEADPDAELYYNDFSMFHPGKRRAVAQLVRRLKDAGVRIDGVGVQAHWGLDFPTLEEADQTISDYAALGVNVMITELDINVLPRPDRRQDAEVGRRFERREAADPYRDGLPDEVQQRLADRYGEIFRLFRRHSDHLSRVTLWGVDDGQSWHNNWPIRGRTAHSLLFDRQYQPKPAFHSVVKAASDDE